MQEKTHPRFSQRNSLHISNYELLTRLSVGINVPSDFCSSTWRGGFKWGEQKANQKRLFSLLPHALNCRASHRQAVQGSTIKRQAHDPPASSPHYLFWPAPSTCSCGKSNASLWEAPSLNRFRGSTVRSVFIKKIKKKLLKQGHRFPPQCSLGQILVPDTSGQVSCFGWFSSSTRSSEAIALKGRNQWGLWGGTWI